MNWRKSYSFEKVSAMSLVDHVFYFFMLFVGFISTSLFGIWWFEPNHIPQNFGGLFHAVDFTLFVILSYIVWYQVTNELFFWVTAFLMKEPKQIKPAKNKKVAFLTAFVPGKEPYDVLENTLGAMTKADYPHDTWLLDEGNDAEAKRLCASYGVKHYSRKGVAKYNQPAGEFKAKTKAGNYNSWYDQHGNEYDFVAQIDVDFIPRRDFLTKTLGYFKDPEVGFVGSPQVYGNTKDSWIAQGAAEQAYSFHGPMQKGFYGQDMTLFIGANHVVRVAAHNTIEGYSGHIVEDHLTGMKFYTKKWKSIYVPEILALGEGPATWDAYFSQQMRWAYGLFHILFTKSPKLFVKMRLRHILNYYLLQQYYFYGLTQLLGIMLITLYCLFGIQSTSMKLVDLLILYPPVLIVQQFIFLWLQKFNINPKNESGLMLRSKLLSLAVWPIYVMALFGVMVGKRLNYAVTPKGSKQEDSGNVKLFIPHVIFGSITMADMVLSFYTHHQAVQILVWAWLNSTIMFYFVFTEVLKELTGYVEKLKFDWLFSSFVKVGLSLR